MIKSKMSSILILLLTVVLTSAAQAQDVYNFYFQKAPGGTVTPSTTVTPQPSTLAPAAPAGTPVATPIAQTAIVTTASPTTTEDKPKFFNWNVQLLRADVSDSYSDVNRSVRERLGLQVGYRFSKYVGAEIGSSFGSIYSSWKDSTGADLSSSFVPYGGLRVNPLHLNIFGTEMLEIFMHGGLMYAAAQGRHPYVAHPADQMNSVPDASLYGYLGGGVRVAFGDRIGLEFAYRVKNGDDRYGISSVGVDVRL